MNQGISSVRVRYVNQLHCSAYGAIDAAAGNDYKQLQDDPKRILFEMTMDYKQVLSFNWKMNGHKLISDKVYQT